MEKFYTVDICGKKVDLPVLSLSTGIGICFFNLHGNVNLTEWCAEKLKERLSGYDFDVILTAESKGLQLTHSLALKLGQPFYAVARKSLKLYMKDGISVDVNSVTTQGSQKLYLSAHDVELIKGKKVALVDDVISTGGSMRGLESLALNAGAQVAVKAAVLSENGGIPDSVTLANIPIF